MVWRDDSRWRRKGLRPSRSGLLFELMAQGRSRRRTGGAVTSSSCMWMASMDELLQLWLRGATSISCVGGFAPCRMRLLNEAATTATGGGRGVSADEPRARDGHASEATGYSCNHFDGLISWRKITPRQRMRPTAMSSIKFAMPPSSSFGKQLRPVPDNPPACRKFRAGEDSCVGGLFRCFVSSSASCSCRVSLIGGFSGTCPGSGRWRFAPIDWPRGCLLPDLRSYLDGLLREVPRKRNHRRPVPRCESCKSITTGHTRRQDRLGLGNLTSTL